MIPSYEISLMGENGSTCLIPATGPITGKFFCIQLLEDSIINQLGGNMSGVANLTGVSLIAGTTIFGSFSDVGLSDGMAIIYNR
jgi:hypothetical protein